MNKAKWILAPCTALALVLSGYGSANASESSTAGYGDSVSASDVEYTVGSNVDGGDRIGGTSDRFGDRSDRFGGTSDRFGDRSGRFGGGIGSLSDGPGDRLRDDDLDDGLFEEELLEERRPGPGFYDRVCERAVWPPAWQVRWCEGWWTV